MFRAAGRTHRLVMSRTSEKTRMPVRNTSESAEMTHLERYTLYTRGWQRYMRVQRAGKVHLQRVPGRAYTYCTSWQGTREGIPDPAPPVFEVPGGLSSPVFEVPGGLFCSSQGAREVSSALLRVPGRPLLTVFEVPGGLFWQSLRCQEASSPRPREPRRPLLLVPGSPGDLF